MLYLFLDIILGLLLLYGFIRGLWNGFFVELASLISLLAGIYVAVVFSGLLESVIKAHVSWNAQWIGITAFALTFILVVVAISLLSKVLTKVAGFSGLGLFNKLLGGLFGIVKMVLILSVSIALLSKISGSFRNAKADESILFDPISDVAGIIYPSLEEWAIDLKDKIN